MDKFASYGGPVHRFKGACSNKLTIRHDRLERQFLDALASRVLQPDMLEHAILEFQNRLQHNLSECLDERERARAEAPRLKSDLRRLETEARNLGDAIAEIGSRHSPTLLSRLEFLEGRIEALTSRLQEESQEPQLVPLDRVRHFVLRQADRLLSVLLSDRTTAKLA